MAHKHNSANLHSETEILLQSFISAYDRFRENSADIHDKIQDERDWLDAGEARDLIMNISGDAIKALKKYAATK